MTNQAQRIADFKARVLAQRKPPAPEPPHLQEVRDLATAEAKALVERWGDAEISFLLAQIRRLGLDPEGEAADDVRKAIKTLVDRFGAHGMTALLAAGELAFRMSRS